MSISLARDVSWQKYWDIDAVPTYIWRIYGGWTFGRPTGGVHPFGNSGYPTYVGQIRSRECGVVDVWIEPWDDVMKYAATFTATGILGLLLLEALKILLAPVAAWLLLVVMFVVKAAVIGLGVVLALVLSVYMYKRMTRDPDEVAL